MKKTYTDICIDHVNNAPQSIVRDDCEELARRLKLAIETIRDITSLLSGSTSSIMNKYQKLLVEFADKLEAIPEVKE